MKQFDTSVQELKNRVLSEVARCAFDGKLETDLIKAPEKLIPGPKALMRCCIYKERAVINERVHMAMGGNRENPNIVEVMPIACDECPVSQISVTPACRGCIAHRCVNTCPKDAITIVDHKAIINHDKCISCGKCISACPYNAIIKQQRPCERACKLNAIKMGEDEKATIDNDKCITCGQCVYQCPFGAIMDKSYIVDVIKALQGSNNNKDYEVYAIVAPAIATQFGAEVGQVVSGLKKLGFFTVIEAAWGADMVAYKEASELVEKGFLTSSCCPAFVSYIEKNFPAMAEHISHNYSPMVEIASYIKKTRPNCKTVFVGPCIAKKGEAQLPKTKGLVDYVITFEELWALFSSRDIDPTELPNEALDNASYFGRVFARSGGVSDAVVQALKEHNIGDAFELKAHAASGIDECRLALLKASKGILAANFIEGMACEQGCIGGPGCCTHELNKDKSLVDKYGKEAIEKTIGDAISVLYYADKK